VPAHPNCKIGNITLKSGGTVRVIETAPRPVIIDQLYGSITEASKLRDISGYVVFAWSDDLSTSMSWNAGSSVIQPESVPTFIKDKLSRYING